MPGYDPATCYNVLKERNFPPCPNTSGDPTYGGCCPGEYNPSYHQFCFSSGNLYTPYLFIEAYNATKCSPDEYDATKCDERVFATIDDLMKFLNANPDYKPRNCYCCCSCVVYSTPMATPTGMDASSKLMVGNSILKGNLVSGKGLSWTPAKVTFSQGIQASDPETEEASTMIFIYCGENVSLVLTEDQLTMMASGKLKQASTLVPGDLLMTADGSTAKITKIKSAQWFGGIHHISINPSYEGNINDHLLNANGFVIGDFSIQMSKDLLLGTDFEKAPQISSAEYKAKNKAMNIGPDEYALS
ncbi:MAG: hypothetical protein V4506_18160 [Bacteroidota bacterium]